MVSRFYLCSLLFFQVLVSCRVGGEEFDILKEFKTLELRIQQLEYKNWRLQEELNERKDNEKRLEKKLHELSENAKKRDVGQNTPEVGFLATVSNDEHHLHVDQPIIFDLVLTNIGNAYDSSKGTFTCPMSGTYLFNFNIMAADSDYVEGSIIVNGDHKIHALSDHQSGTTSWDQGSTSAILALNEADVVTVGIQWPQGENTVHGNRYTTFSGYLLRAAL